MTRPHPDRLDSIAQYLATGRAPGVTGDESVQLDGMRGLLADEAMWASPPPELAEPIVRGVEASAAVAARRGLAQRARWPVVGASAVAAALVVALLVTERLGRSGTDDVTQVALAGTNLAPDASGSATARETPTGLAITLHVDGLAPAPPRSYYQAWLAGEAGPVAIGTFHVRAGDDDRIELWSGVDPDAYPTLTVTIEPEDGNPASSGRRVLAGTLE